jgi:hypothetical protein
MTDGIMSGLIMSGFVRLPAGSPAGLQISCHVLPDPRIIAASRADSVPRVTNSPDGWG